MTREELETTYTDNYDSLVQHAKRQLRKTPLPRSEEAEDIVHEVFTYLLSGDPPRYIALVGGPGFPAYLRMAVEHRVFNIVRHEVDTKNPADAALRYLSQKHVQPDPSKSLFQLFDQVVNQHADPKVRELLRLVFLEEWSPLEAADHLGMNHSSARGAVVRMREHMKRAMERTDNA